MIEEVRKKSQARMEKALDALKREFAGVRTGRASTHLLDGIHVPYYGTETPLSQVASLSVPEPRLIVIQPWQASLIPDIEKAIQKSDLGLTPSNDGKIVRLAVPPLTEERRKELAKVVKKMAEEARVSIRNVRRDGNEEFKKLEKAEHVGKDDIRKASDDLQKMTDQWIKKIDDLLAHKEAEIMEV